MASKSDLQEKVREFLSRVPSIREPRYHEFDVREVSPAHTHDEWRIRPGIYYFSLRDTVQYVGVGSSAWGAGYRVYEGLSKIGIIKFRTPADPKWNVMLSDPSSRVGIFEFDPSDWYWTISLEAFLISSLRPPLNREGVDRASQGQWVREAVGWRRTA